MLNVAIITTIAVCVNLAFALEKKEEQKFEAKEMAKAKEEGRITIPPSFFILKGENNMDTINAYKMQDLVNATMKNMLNMCYGVPKNLEHNGIKTVTVNPIEKVIFNPPATIVFWKDGDKTVVQTRGDDEFNPEIGLAMAISKHYLCDICGLKRYDGVFKKYIPKEQEKPSTNQDMTSHSVQHDGLSRALGIAFMSGVCDALSKREDYEDAD